jgi:hypothetical protein
MHLRKHVGYQPAYTCFGAYQLFVIWYPLELAIDDTHSHPPKLASRPVHDPNALCSFGRGALVQPARRDFARRRQHHRLPAGPRRDGQCRSVPVCGIPRRKPVQRQFYGQLLAEGLRLVQSRRRLLLQRLPDGRPPAVRPARLRGCAPPCTVHPHLCKCMCRCVDTHGCRVCRCSRA